MNVLLLVLRDKERCVFVWRATAMHSVLLKVSALPERLTNVLMVDFGVHKHAMPTDIRAIV